VSPEQIFALISEQSERHTLRVANLKTLSAAERALEALLHEAADRLAPPTPPGRWLGLLERLGLVVLEATPPPMPAELWRIHEATVEKVRSLSLHRDMLRHELDALRADQDTLSSVVSNDPVLQDELAGLAVLHELMVPALTAMIPAVTGLIAQGEHATASLAHDITQLGDDLAAQTSQEIIGRLHSSLGELALKADSCVLTLTRDLEGLGDRLRALDEDARQRRAARLEVDALRRE